MPPLYEILDVIVDFVKEMSDFLWEFPTFCEWYARIPILGNMSFAIVLLIGAGIYFSFKFCFIQVTHFRAGIQIMLEEGETEDGISPLTAFLLSSAMRLGPGNIIGVTGAIAIGGPGALFWMWISAFFSMAVAYIEGVLAQVFKEKNGDEFVGGLSFYGRRLLGDKVWIGVALSVLYILYACFTLPSYGFNMLSSIGEVTELILGKEINHNAMIYYVIGGGIIALTAMVAFGGIKSVTKWTDRIVPIMAILYMIIALILMLCNIDEIPYFFLSVFQGAFQPEAVFGGSFSVALAQGVKRGLMTHEAGQGTITMSAASASGKHPCEQGFLASIGVFLDTIVICTLTGFVLIMAHCWEGTEGARWLAKDKLPMFVESVKVLMPGTKADTPVVFVVLVCFALFTYACLLGMISFSEIAANRISMSRRFLCWIRVLGLVVALFGILCNLTGFELGNLWGFSDLGNILIVLINVPILFRGTKVVYLATEHYKKADGTPFTSEIVQRNDCTYWDERAKRE